MRSETKRRHFLGKTVAFIAIASIFVVIMIIAIGNPERLLTAATDKKGEKTNQEEKKGEPKTQRLFLVRVSSAKLQNLAAVRPFIGRLKEEKKVTLSPEVGGILTKLPVEEGDRVVGGETVIAEIDTTWTNLALEQTKTQIDLINVQLDFQRKELERYEQLRLSNSVSISEFDLQKMTVAELVKQLETAELTQNEAQEKLDRSRIVAPFDGFVVNKLAEVGQLLSPGTNIVEIISRGDVDGVILVGEAHIDRIHIGDKIPILVETMREEMQGEVIAIVPYGPSGSRTFPVKLRLKNDDEKLKVGMSLTAYVTISDPREGIVVPKDAVLEHPEGQTVWVAIAQAETSTAKAFSVPVKVRVRSPQSYLVTPETDEGAKVLVDGAQVVIEGAERLSQNQIVSTVQIKPEILENLPHASGHETIQPQARRSAD